MAFMGNQANSMFMYVYQEVLDESITQQTFSNATDMKKPTLFGESTGHNEM